MNTKEFIEKSKSVHGDKYDYSKSEYVSSSVKVCIICPEHGEFYMLPYNHMAGHGCRKCESESRYLTTSEYIERAKKVYGNTYDYSKTVYKGIKELITVTCPDHGDFSVLPYYHLKGRSCPVCNNRVFNNEVFIEKTRRIHGNKYDYSKVEYKKANEKVCIICPEHGEFWQTPQKHLDGCGCKKCSMPNCDLTTEQFIEKAKEVHGDKYDYSKVEYKNFNEKVCIICLEHGEFWQTPQKHLYGQGCPKCGGRMKKTTEEFINELKDIYGDRYDYTQTKYVNSNTKVGVICKKHGLIYRMPNDWLKGGGCVKCKCSISENVVEKLLQNNNINYISQFMPKWLKSKNKHQQSLDFYLPDYNLGIECQGGQHFRPIEAFGGDNEFKVIIERDENKLKLCKKHNIKILYFSNEHTIPQVFLEKYSIIRNTNDLLTTIKNESTNTK